MLRAVIGVIVGYLVMAVFLMLTFTGAYFAMGASGAFKEGTHEVSAAWIGASFVLGLIGAVLGGFVCAAIGRRAGAVQALCIVVLVLGLLSAVMEIKKPDPGPRTGDVSNVEAMTKAKTPTWIALLNPVVGVVGVLIGGRMKKPPAPSA